MRCVKVAASGAYDILIGPGLLDQVGDRMSEVIRPCKVALVTDDRVDRLYGARVRSSLGAAGYEVMTCPFPNGEQSKTLGTLSDLLERFGWFGMTKSDAVVCLGGGVAGDMGGFAAAVYARGIRFVQIPTTLLAAVDSSVGGKTAVNLGAAKNMAGTFAQPSLVLCDVDVLGSLPERLISEGAAEVIKYGVLAEPELLQLVADGRLKSEMEHVVERSVLIKREYVQADEFDRAERQLLNLGHTIGHAVEKCSGYQTPHGEGVGIGLLAIARAAWAMGISEENCAPMIEKALLACGLPTDSPYGALELVSAAMMDKKRSGADITLAVPVRMGHCILKKIPATQIGAWIEAGGIA